MLNKVLDGFYRWRTLQVFYQSIQKYSIIPILCIHVDNTPCCSFRKKKYSRMNHRTCIRCLFILNCLFKLFAPCIFVPEQEPSQNWIPNSKKMLSNEFCTTWQARCADLVMNMSGILSLFCFLISTGEKSRLCTYSFSVLYFFFPSNTAANKPILKLSILNSVKL